jgi:hypothetical protein
MQWLSIAAVVFFVCVCAFFVAFCRALLKSVNNILKLLMVFEDDLRLIKHYSRLQYRNQLKLLELGGGVETKVIEGEVK